MSSRHQLPSGSEGALIGGLVSTYLGLFRRFGGARQVFLPGATASRQILWQKLREVVEWCDANGAAPLDFLTAQFECWSGASGLPAPTPRHVGVTPASKDRYVRWMARRQSVTVHEEMADRTVAAVMDGRQVPEEVFWRDPLSVRLVAPEVARANPTFASLVASGAFDDPFSRVVLANYL